jgi:hypothetical protein
MSTIPQIRIVNDDIVSSDEAQQAREIYNAEVRSAFQNVIGAPDRAPEVNVATSVEEWNSARFYTWARSEFHDALGSDYGFGYISDAANAVFNALNLDDQGKGKDAEDQLAVFNENIRNLHN